MPEAQVFNGFGRHGGNISPHLAWDGVPAGTKSFVVTVFDPDAPTASGWWHWVVVDIPASAHELARGAGSGTAKLPDGALQTRTNSGHPGYGGAAPPAGQTHHYIFTVHALKISRLNVAADTSATKIESLSHANTLGQATLTVTYGP
jgi:Raf kinase inhibitor-like YbhB/YbcL family protein